MSQGWFRFEVMARELRLDPPGGWHHVTNQGLRKGLVFLNDGDRSLFVRFLADAVVKYETSACAYCLMGNHFHLVLRCPEGGLSSTMQHLKGRYASAFNRRHGLDGAVFRSRFFSKLIVDDAQLLASTRYVHRNPLELGYRIDTYPWSSYSMYLAGETTGWFKADVPLELVGGPVRYRRFVEQPLPADDFSIRDGVRSIVKPLVPEPESIAAIEQLVISASPRILHRPTRKHAILLIASQSGYPISEVARYLGYASPNSARAALTKARRRLDRDEPFARIVSRASPKPRLHMVG